MIAEWLTSLRVSCVPPMRRMGYHRELVAISYRHRRQREMWRPHLQKTTDAINTAMGMCTGKNIVVILGAGILLDIPLEEICRQFRQVHLVDAAFLPGTRKAARRHANCRLISCDITGTAQALRQLSADRTGDTTLPLVLPMPKDPLELSAIEPDLTLSVNILSQLPVLPRQYLEWQFANQLERMTPQIDEFCHGLVAHHLKWLKGLPGRACLISDVKRIYYRGDSGQPEDVIEEDPLYGVRLGDDGMQWTWDVAPPGEQANGIGIRNLVQANVDLV